MLAWIDLTGPRHSLTLFGIRLVGFNGENARKLLLSLALILLLMLLSRLLRGITRLLPQNVRQERIGFWIRQAISVTLTMLMVVGFLSIWFEDPARLGTMMGLFSAGLAFAL